MLSLTVVQNSLRFYACAVENLRCQRHYALGVSVCEWVRASRNNVVNTISQNAVAMSPKIGDGFYVKTLSPKIFGYRCTRFDYVPDCYYEFTLILRVIFTYDYTPPKPHFSTRIPIACQLYEHANKLLQKSFEVAQPLIMLLPHDYQFCCDESWNRRIERTFLLAAVLSNGRTTIFKPLNSRDVNWSHLAIQV